MFETHKPILLSVFVRFKKFLRKYGTVWIKADFFTMTCVFNTIFLKDKILLAHWFQLKFATDYGNTVYENLRIIYERKRILICRMFHVTSCYARTSYFVSSAFIY